MGKNDGRNSMLWILLSARMLPETAQSYLLVGIHVEDGEKSGDLQQIVHPFCQGQKFHLTVAARDGSISADQFADSRAVDVVHISKIQQNSRALLIQQIAQRFPQESASVAQRDSPAQINNRYLTCIAVCGSQCHFISFF
jgi:hypothetical protein